MQLSPVPPAGAPGFTLTDQAGHHVTGQPPRPGLRVVWQAYNVAVEAPSPNADIIHSSAMYFIDRRGRERYLASPMADHTAAGSSYLPAGQLTAWGQGIAQVARQLAG
jgi:cytochrome oxidase Cu insertion factor (SCO1/SenC/PrrC family)